MANLVELVREKVILGPKPAVYISGGLDSTIVLHHLREKYTGRIYTYHAKFGVDEDECDKARRVSEHYNTVHKEVKIDNFVETLPEIMRFYERPRYNVWPYWLARRARADGRETVYIGEGSDEYFGGYPDRDYLTAWAGQVMYVRYTYNEIHKYIGLDLKVPFSDIDWRRVVNYYSPPDKRLLRLAYAQVLGLDIMNLAKSQPVAFVNMYWWLWNSSMSKHFPEYKPKSTNDIRRLLQFLVTKIWVDEHESSSSI